MGISVSDEIPITDDLYGVWPSVSEIDGDGWIVSWVEADGTLFTQRYNADGSARGDRITVADLGSGMPFAGRTYAMANGSWLHTFQTREVVNGIGHTYFNVVGYDADGNQISNYSEPNDRLGELILLENSSYVLLSYAYVSDHVDKITATFFDPAGHISATKVLGNSSWYSTREILEDGTWSFLLTDEGENGEYRLYDSQGNLLNSVDKPLEGEVKFNSDGSYSVLHTQVDYTTSQIYKTTERYSADGTLIDTVGHAPMDFSGTYYSDRTVTLSNGTQLQFWVDAIYYEPGKLHLRVMDASGNLLVPDSVLFDINPYQNDSSVLELSSGGWIVKSGMSSMQVFNPDGTKHGPIIADPHSPLFMQATDDGGWSSLYFEAPWTAGSNKLYQRNFHPNDINNVPLALDVTRWGYEDTQYAFDPETAFGYDFDGDGITSIVIESLPTKGSFTFEGEDVEIGQIIDVADIAALRWMPDPNLNGEKADFFRFKAIDENGAMSTKSATFYFSVSGINDAPSGRDHVVNVLEDKAYRLTAEDLAFDDIDGNSLWVLLTKPLDDHGTLYHNNQKVRGRTAIYGDETIYFLADENASGMNYARFSTRVTDSGGTENGGHDTDPNTYTLTFNVIPVNDAPKAHDTALWMEAGQTMKFIDRYIEIDDIEDDNLKSIIIDELPETGVLRLGGRRVHSGDEIAANQIGRLSFEFDKNAGGANDSARFTYFARDDGGTRNGGIDTDTRVNAVVFHVVDNANVINGTVGKDRLVGGAKADIIQAGAGDDVLYGGKRDDRLYGGSGSDVFVLKDLGDTDTIYDFDPERDKIDLSDTPLHSFHAVAAHHFDAAGNRLWIGYDADKAPYLSKVGFYLLDVEFDDLSARNFIF